MDTKKKDKEPTDMASMQRALKQITNELIDLKKSKGEGKKPFKPFIKKGTYSAPQIPPTSGINIEDYAMDNFCHTYHVNHSERTCPEFINSFTAMLTPPELPKKDKRSDKEEEDEDQEEEEEEEGEEPPSHLNILRDEDDFRYEDDDDLMEEACIGNDYNLQSKGALNKNDTPSTLKTNNKNVASKQPSTDKTSEKEKEKEKEKKSTKEIVKEKEITPSRTPISLDLTQKILGDL